jgi:hypothetical protein
MRYALVRRSELGRRRCGSRGAGKDRFSANAIAASIAARHAFLDHVLTAGNVRWQRRSDSCLLAGQITLQLGTAAPTLSAAPLSEAVPAASDGLWRPRRARAHVHAAGWQFLCAHSRVVLSRLRPVSGRAARRRQVLRAVQGGVYPWIVQGLHVYQHIPPVDLIAAICRFPRGYSPYLARTAER